MVAPWRVTYLGVDLHDIDPGTMQTKRISYNIAAAWGGVSGVALKGNPDTGFVYKAQPSAHDAFFVAGLSKHTRSHVFLDHPQVPQRCSELSVNLAFCSSAQLTLARSSSLSAARVCSGSAQLALSSARSPQLALAHRSSL